MKKDLSGLLQPKTIAVVGASRSPEKVGAIVLKNILESKFPGKVYPINPQAEAIYDLPCLKSISDLPAGVDLAIIALPAAVINETLIQIGEKGIKNAVVFSAGFKETGEEGSKLETELINTAGKYGINVIGPNCLGFVNNFCPLNATFGQPNNSIGNLRFISQSGAIATGMFDWFTSVGLGFSHFITLGNKAVLNENDFLEYFLNSPADPNMDTTGLSSVRPIGMYLESISDGQEFLRLTGELTKSDPVFVIKPGKSLAAAKAMQSHTGAIAGEDYILDAALDQAGVLRCQTLEDFFDLSRAFAFENAPTGPRLAVISNAGGPAVISADAVETSGLKLAEIDPETKNKLLQVLPRSASIRNPVDVLGDALADRYAQAAEIILQTNQADALLVLLTPQMMTQVAKTAEIISDLSKKYAKPIFCSFIGGQLVSEGEQILNQSKIPSFRFPERAIAAIGAMWKWRQRQSLELPEVTEPQLTGTEQGDKIKQIITQAVANNHRTLDNLEADEVMKLLGIPTPPTAAAATVEEAKNVANSIGWPVVLKLSSPGLLHKANVGGVITDIWNEEQLEIAHAKLTSKITELPPDTAKNIRFQVQKDVPEGVEVIVGLKHDPTFGPVLLVGAGGSLAELVADRNLKILPITRQQAVSLVSQSKVFRLMKSQPGEPGYALEKLYDLIIRLTQTVALIPEVTDIEINPVIVTHNDVWAVDSKIILTGGTAAAAAVQKFHAATIVSNTVLSTKFHYVEILSDEPLLYQPGQYVSIKVAPNRINSYSVAGHADERRFFLLIDTNPGGPGSKFFENLKSGDRIAYLGPFGIFTFKPDDGAKRIVFLGTGSGCSPLRTILEAALKNLSPETQIDFYLGLRHTDDVFWKEYFEKLTGEYKNFRFHLVLSQPDEKWQGETGHITEMLGRDIVNADNCSAYLCGNPKMIEESTKILTTLNCPKERIYTEKF